MKHLSMIACISRDRGLGRNGELLWSIPEDMQFFRETTTGGTIAMGRKTYESIGRPLPNRKNIILSRQPLDIPDVVVINSSDDLSNFLENQTSPTFIIGGASLYQMYLDQAEKLYLTEVDAVKPADTYFPEFDKTKFLRKVIKTGQQDNINYEIVEYTRKP